MKYQPLRIGNLVAKKPIIQGGMGIGISLGNLAGGITDAADAKHAFDLGVDALQIASRFVTTEECDADIRFKESYLHANEGDIVIVQSPVGMPGRAILNPFMEKIMEGKKQSPTKCLKCLRNCNPT